MKNAIEINNLVKKYDKGFTLGEINLMIPSGCVIGLIGENGAGKTTLLKSILNIIKYDNGSIKIFDKDNKVEESVIKEEIGVVLDDTFFPELLMVKDINSIMKDVYKNWSSNLFEEYLNKFKIEKNKIIKNLSKGMRKKLEIATALSHKPKLLILDEPTSGLDPIVRNDVLDIFLDFIKDEEHTILLSTHITSDLEHIADKIVFINEGKVVLNENRDELIDSYGVLKCDIDKFDTISKDDIIKYKKNRYNYDILIKDREKISKKYDDYIIDKASLEDIMLIMIKGDK